MKLKRLVYIVAAEQTDKDKTGCREQLLMTADTFVEIRLCTQTTINGKGGGKKIKMGSSVFPGPVIFKSFSTSLFCQGVFHSSYSLLKL